MAGIKRAATALLTAAVMASVLLGAVAAVRGYRIYVIHTGSMSPTYRPGAVVIDSPPRTLRSGDVITFLHSNKSGDVVTHRIVGFDDGAMKTKGDANATPDVWRIRPDQVHGVVVASVPRLGFLLVFFQQPAGVAAVMSSVLSLALLWGLFFPASAAREQEAAPDEEQQEPTRQPVGPRVA